MSLKLPKFPDHCSYHGLPSPVGKLGIVVSDRGLHAVLWPQTLEDDTSKARISACNSAAEHPLYLEVSRQLAEYFAGQRRKFELPLALEGTQFQVAAWKALQKIPYGQTISYEEQATRLGGKEKVRAVGAANGKNPIPIIVPCHRVIGKNGTLTGFGGGLSNKAYLLNLESGDS